jgi:uncharacterized protein (DUF1778 family)
MAKTRRVQVLMEPEQLELLEEAARAARCSVSELLREAARAQVLVRAQRARRRAAAQRFLELPEQPLPGWKTLKTQLAGRRG